MPPTRGLAEAARDAGRLLGAAIADRVGPMASADLTGVRIHTGAASQIAADALGARAFTIGRDIHFAANGYQPDTIAGDRLIAHELAHALQPGARGDGS